MTQAPSGTKLDATLTGVNIEDAARDFLRQLRVENKSARTLQTYGESISKFAAFLAARRMPTTADGFTREHVQEFLLDLGERGMKPATVSNRFRALKRFCGWLVDEGERTDNPMGKMSPPRIPEYQPRVLTRDELHHIKESIGKDTSFAGRRDLALFLVFADTGARRSEIAGLRLNYQYADSNGRPVGPIQSDLDLDQPAGALLTLMGKGGRERIVRIGDVAALALRRYLRLRARSKGADTPWLWLNAKGKRLTDSGAFQALRKRAEDAGIEGFYLHQMRHSAAHDWLMNGGTEIDLQSRMGWSSPAMLRRYASTTRAERSHAAHERFGLGDKL
jgi:site-specific recombinase XerD